MEKTWAQISYCKAGIWSLFPKLSGLLVLPERHGILIAPCLIPLGVCLTSASLADEYSFGYGVEGGYEAIDNVALRPDQQLDISGAQLTLPLSFTAKSERRETQVAGSFKTSKYDEEAWDSDDFDVRGQSSYLLEKGEVGGYLGFKRDSTRTGEFLDTGVIGFQATRREAVTGGLSAENLLTERNGFAGSISYRSVEFESPLLRDFEASRGEFGWLHRWSERTKLRLQVYGSRFENDDELGGFDSVTDTVGAQFGIGTTLNENVSFEIVTGLVSLESDYSNEFDSFESDEVLFKGTMSYEAERHRLGITVATEPSASGIGVAVIGDYVGVKYDYALSDRSKLKIAVDVGSRSAIDDRFNIDRDFASVDFTLDYRVSRSWYLAANYGYFWQEQSQAIDSADSTRVGLSVVFRPEKKVWSR